MKRVVRLVAIPMMAVSCSVAGAVRSRAAGDFSCPEDRVRVEETTDTHFTAEGCGRRALYNRAARSPIQRAAFDLACPPQQLEMTELGNNTIGVEGCGKKASYAWVDWAWVGNVTP